MPDPFFSLRRRIAASIALAALLPPMVSSAPVWAADWGYDDAPPSKTTAPPLKSGKILKKASSGQAPETRADETSLRSPAVKSPAIKNPAVKSPAGQKNTIEVEEKPLAKVPAKPTAEELAARQKTQDLKSWMQIYALCASSPNQDDRGEILKTGTLGEELRKKLEKITFEKIDRDVSQYRSVATFWPPLSAKVVDDLDYKESYRLLFRALLRHALGHMDKTSVEAEAFHEILGPTRIAEMGPPVLTEDAITAYSDMTCFIYQKNHPDHTLEGEDNRLLFADVIRHKYNDAPNPAAKKAMCNFDLTWAAFRCRYLDASEADKVKLVGSFGKSSSAATANLAAARVLKIFATGPWAEQVQIAAAARALGKDVDAEEELTAKSLSLSDVKEGPKTTPVATKMSQKSAPTK